MLSRRLTSCSRQRSHHIRIREDNPLAAVVSYIQSAVAEIMYAG